MYTQDETAIANLARTPGLTLAQSKAILTSNYAAYRGDPVEYARQTVKLYLEGNAQATARKAAATPNKPAVVPTPAATPPKPASPKAPAKPLPTLADIGARIAKLEAERAHTPAARDAAREADQRAEQRSRIEAAFGNHPQRGVTFDGVVQRFG